MAKIEALTSANAVGSPAKTAEERAGEAREAGNASYKKGKWAEAIGHYTTSSVLNAQDPAPLLNRAQAYLKLEKWLDAQRDCSTVLALSGQQRNVKALFRRALASKELGERTSAEKDVKLILSIEPGNSAAKEELADLAKKAVSKGKRPANPPASVPTVSSATPKLTQAPSGSISVKATAAARQRVMTAIPIRVVPRFSDDKSAAGSTSLDSPSPTQGVRTDSTAGPSTFADKRAKRDKKSFITPSSRSGPSHAEEVPFIASDMSASSSSNSALEATAILKPSRPPPQRSDQPVDTDADIIMRSGALSPVPSKSVVPSGRRSVRNSVQTPKSGMEFFEKLEAPATNVGAWDVIQSLEPKDLVALVANIIEPDQLATLLRVFHGVLQLDEESGDGTREEVKEYMMALRGMRQWTMTSLMLNEEESAMEGEVWERCR